MRFVGKIVGILLTLVAVPLFVLAACNAAIDKTIRSPETYADTLANDAIFQDLVPVALPAIMQAASAEMGEVNFLEDSPVQLQDVMETLEPEAWREVTNLLVSPAELQERTNQLLTAMLNIANGNLDAIHDEFDLTDLRQRLAGTEAQQATALILDNAPECTLTQTDRIRTLAAIGEGELPICNPADAELREVSTSTLIAWFGMMADALEADKPTVAEFLDMNRDNARAINITFELNRQGMLLVFLCPMALLALTVTLMIRSMKGLGRWVGGSLVIAGIGVLVLLIMVQVLAFSIVSSAINGNSELDVFLGRIASEMVRSAFAQASGTMFLFMGIYVAIGFVLFAITWIITRDDDDDGEMVLIGDDGAIISTASQKRIGQLGNETV
jgi:hypothetical protein